MPVWVEHGILRFECPNSGGGSGSGLGAGRGAAVPSIRTGAATMGTVREERLEGTLAFIGLRRLGPDGQLDLDVDLPDHPGRWRVETLVIGDDGGGARAHAVVHTKRALEVWTELPTRLAPGDTAPGALHLRAPSLAGDDVALSLSVPLGIAIEGEVPSRVTLDDHGEATVPLRVAARTSGPAAVIVHARSGAARDDVRSLVTVSPSDVELPVAIAPSSARRRPTCTSRCPICRHRPRCACRSTPASGRASRTCSTGSTRRAGTSRRCASTGSPPTRRSRTPPRTCRTPPSGACCGPASSTPTRRRPSPSPRSRRPRAACPGGGASATAAS